MNEDYVSFEVAKLLKEKKFDWGCQAFYNANRTLAASPVHTINDELEDSDIACPTLYMAQKWLIEKKGLHVSTGFNVPTGRWFYIIMNIREGHYQGKELSDYEYSFFE